MPADARELVHEAERANHRVILHVDVAGQLRAIFQHHAVAEDAVVRHVRVRHDQVVAADARDVAALHRAAVHRREFAKFVCVADFQPATRSPWNVRSCGSPPTDEKE